MNLAFTSVSVVRRFRVVLDALTATFEPGLLTAVIGPNGAGKSTMLACAAGMIEPTRGEVAWNGEPAAARAPGEQARLRAYLPQDAPADSSFTVADVVRMGRYSIERSAASSDHDASAWRAIERTGVEHLADRPMRELSGGERARVALARIVAQDTPIVLLDEPTASLDVGHQTHTMHLLTALAEEGRTVVVVQHDLNLAAAHAHRLVLLNDGRICADGPPESVLTGPRLTAVYDHPLAVISHPWADRPLVVSDDAAAKSPGTSMPRARI